MFFQSILDELSVSSLKTNVEYHPHFAILAAALVVLLVWRLLRFTLVPVFRPNEPKEYPYWIPGIGHLKGFIDNSQSLLTSGRLYFGNTREPFTITLTNLQFYVITRPEDVSEVYRNTATLPFDIFAQEILNYFGCTKSSIQSMYQRADPQKSIHPNPDGKSLARLSHDFHIHQLFPGNLLDQVGALFIHYFDKALTIEGLAQRDRHVAFVSEDSVKVSLLGWSCDTVADSILDIYFGGLLRKIEPDFTKIFLEFDENAWQALFRYPRFLGKKMFGPMDRIVGAIEKYYEAPREDRQDTVWFTPTMEKEMRNVDIGNRDIAIMMMTIYWGANTNTARGAFWMLTYLVYDKDLLECVRAETAPAFKGERTDLDHIWNHSPLLRGVWDETLRVTAFSSSVRFVAEDTVIGGKLLRKDRRIMMPYRQMHLNEAVFGERTGEFDAERFVRNPKLRRYNMAFGGGSSKCPGRHFSGQATMVFVAMMLHRFEISLDPADQKFPEAEESRPVLGLISVKKSSGLDLKLTRRTPEKM